MTPNRPRMSARMLGVGVLDPHLIELRHHDLTLVLRDICLTSHGYPKAFQVLVDSRGIVFHERIFRVRDCGLIAPPSRTEYAEVAEHIGIANPGVKRMKTTHRKTGKCSVGRASRHAKFAFHEGNDRLLQFSAEHDKGLLSEGATARRSHIRVYHCHEHG